MTPRSCAVWAAVTGSAACVGALLTLWALATVGVPGAVFVGGWMVGLPGVMAVVACVHRRELLVARLVEDLAAANERENSI